jgi:hypothetical protein
MFSYAPTTTDRSGEILGAGQMQAAAINAEAMKGLGQDIGGALASIGGAYMEYQDMKSGVKSGEKLLDVMGPSFGMTSDKLKEFDYGNMSLRDKYKFHQGWLNNFATMSQGYNFGRGLEQRADQPFVNQGLQDMRNRAGGNQTITIPPVTPTGLGPPPDDAIVMDGANPNDPAGAAATSAAPAVQQIPLSTIPGGRDSLERLNRVRQKRGQNPHPVPSGT